MMMDCPRCGFSQPKDSYCASCGLDIEHYHVKPKPLIVRILQNPNLHLTLLAFLIIFVIAYIIYSRSSFVSREVHQMFGTPLTSKEASDPNEVVPAAPPSAAPPPAAPAATEAVEAQVAPPGSGPAEAAPPVKDVKKMEMVFWEVAHETLMGLVSAAEKVGESTEGRVYLFKDGSKISDAITAASRRVSQARSVDLAAGAQVMVETPPTTPEPFQFALAVQVTKWENKEAALRWDSQLVLSQPETPTEQASQTPAMKTVVESTLTGSSPLNPAGLLMIIIEPGNRAPREEYLRKAGEGPWRVFASEDFRGGITDWVVLVQLK